MNEGREMSLKEYNIEYRFHLSKHTQQNGGISYYILNKRY